MVMWEKRTVGECTEIISGGTPSTTVPAYWDGGILWCTPTDITKAKRKYLSVTERTISDKGLKDSSAVLLPAGTILLCSRATIGEMCIAAKPISTNQGFKNLICGSDLDSNFMYYLLQTKVETMLELAIGSTFLEISKKALASIEIQLPPLPEQRRIAEALSDMDDLLTSMEKLIDKKRAIKQGAMQELLTGRRRLPGFEGEWVTTTLGELLQYEQPQKYIISSIEYEESGTPVLTAGKSLVLGYTNERNGIYTNLPVIIFDDFTTESKYITYRFKVKSSAMKLLTSTGICEIRLVYALMQMINFPLKDHQRYWISKYSKLEVKIPPTVSEQTAIAAILSDMDAEIDALTAKLNKLRSIKQGMMSELLTGRIRLTESEPIKADSNSAAPFEN